MPEPLRDDARSVDDSLGDPSHTASVDATAAQQRGTREPSLSTQPAAATPTAAQAHLPAATLRREAAVAAVGVPLGALIFVSMVQPIGLNMYVPAMALMQADLATSSAAILSTLSIFLVVTALAQLVMGPLSDVAGRIPVLLAGLSIFVVGSLICAVAPNVETLILGRVVQAIGGCSGLALSRAMVRDVYPAGRAASAIGYVTMGMATAPMVTPAIGGLMAELLSWRAIFVFMGLFAAIATVVAALTLRETHPPSGGKGALGQFAREARELAGVLDFWLFITTLGLVCTMFFAFVAGGVFVAETVLDLGPSEYGLYFITVPLGYVLGNFVTGRFGERIGIVPMIVIGNVIALVGIGIACGYAWVFGPSTFFLFAPMFLMGLGNGFSLPNCVAGAVSVRPHLAGTASGLAGAFQMGGGALAAIIVGWLCDADPWPGTTWTVLVPMLVGSVSSLACGLLLRSDSLR